LSDDVVSLVKPQVPAAGAILGRWLLLQRVDSGSYGVVFRARRADDPSAPPVALKMAKQAEDPRFEREARILQLIQHPSVPCFYELGSWTSADGHRYPFIVMEWVDGAVLYEWFRQRPRSNREVLRVLAPVARALEVLHARGVIHRDVKGDNIRVTPEGRAVLLDFGAAWFPEARALTDTLVPPGTTPYRAPELLRFMWKYRKDLEARWEARPSDDLYALGVTAYRLVTGSYPPPISETRAEEPRKVVRPSELAAVAPELEGTILRLLSDDPQDRGTTAQIVRALERAANQTDRRVDALIVQTSAAVPTEHEVARRLTPPSDAKRTDHSQASAENKRPALRSTFPLWLSWATASVAGGLMVFVVTGLWRDRGAPEVPPLPIAEEHHVPAMDAPDAGVGEEALAAAQDFPRVGAQLNALGRPMPKDPFPGQLRPPCDPKMERVINGACWVGPIGAEKPPCGPKAFDYEERCYMPSFNAPRLPTSGEP
jgi:serine/threonine protein kinase